MAKKEWTMDTIIKKSDPSQVQHDLMPEGNHKETKMAKVNGIKVPMTLKKETPGTYVYASDDSAAVISQLYVKKTAMPGGAWETIVIMVEGT